MDAVTKPKRKSGVTGKKPPYPDLHDHVRALEKAGQLIRVDRPINKDTEMHPLVRWQFRGGIEEKDRKAFLFTNVTDSRGTTSCAPLRLVSTRPCAAISCFARSRPINTTSWPAARHLVPSEPPMLPLPITAILMPP